MKKTKDWAGNLDWSIEFRVRPATLRTVFFAGTASSALDVVARITKGLPVVDCISAAS